MNGAITKYFDIIIMQIIIKDNMFHPKNLYTTSPRLRGLQNFVSWKTLKQDNFLETDKFYLYSSYPLYDWLRLDLHKKIRDYRTLERNVQVLNSSAIASGYAGRDPQGGFAMEAFYGSIEIVKKKCESSSLFLKLRKRKRKLMVKV